MKRICSFLLLLTVLLTAMPVPVHAENPTLSVRCPEQAAAGETVTVELTADAIIDCATVTIILQYDPEVMEAVSAAAGDAFADGISTINLEYDDDLVFVSLTRAEGADLCGVAASVQFRLRSTAEGTAVWTVAYASATNSTGQTFELTGGSGTMTVTAMEKARITIVPEAGADGTVLLHLDLSDATYYCGLSLVFGYDSSCYEVVAAQRGAAFEAAAGAVNPGYGAGEVFVSVLYSEPVCINDRVITVTLRPKAGSAAAEPFSVEILEYIDSDLVPLQIDWQFEAAAPTGLTGTAAEITGAAGVVNLGAAEQTYQVVLAVYAESGRMLGAAAARQTVSAGGCGDFDLTVPKASGAAYAVFYFLDGAGCPLRPCVRQTISGSK